MNELKDYIASDIEDYMVSDYLASEYDEPAQILAYEDAYQIVEAISNGDFLQGDDHIMLRSDKSKKMLEMLEQKLLKGNKIHLDTQENQVEGKICFRRCAIF